MLKEKVTSFKELLSETVLKCVQNKLQGSEVSKSLDSNSKSILRSFRKTSEDWKICDMRENSSPTVSMKGAPEKKDTVGERL